MIRYNPHIKRTLDILFSSAALCFLAPFFIILCILICAESEGGPFFFQRRIGKGMVPFRLVKFRSMRQDKEALLLQFEPGESGRVTRIGGLLRKTKLDELPELFNVLFGDMSVTGPRPEVKRYVDAYPDEFRVILEVRPGLSDFASIKYRNEEEILASAADPEHHYVAGILPDKLRLAAEFVERLSFRTDMEVISETLRSLLHLER
jgi:lipopolysaccharide/colanic/teichoic acid biosynthesis glycosyltransferase